MTASTKTIITTAIKADPSMTEAAKDRMIRDLTKPRPDDPPEIRFVTERQAASILAVSRSTISRMKRDGTLKTGKVRGVSRIRIDSVYAI